MGRVEALSGFGLPLRQIARLAGVSADILRAHYQDELDLGAARANAKVIKSLYRKATGEGTVPSRPHGAVAAAIFWAKARCGWQGTTATS